MTDLRVDTTHHAPHHCPSCRHVLDASTGVGREGPVVPAPGDVTLCAYCRTWLVYTDGLGLRPAEPDEVEQVDPTLRALVQQHLDAVDQLRPKH